MLVTLLRRGLRMLGRERSEGRILLFVCLSARREWSGRPIDEIGRVGLVKCDEILC